MSAPSRGPGPAPASGPFSGRRLVAVQGGLVVCCSAASLAFGGGQAALAALLGGGAALAGTLAFLGLLAWRRRPAPTAWQALRDLFLAEAAKWAVSLAGLAVLLSGLSGLEAAGAAPGAVLIGFCVAWAAPLLSLVKKN